MINTSSVNETALLQQLHDANSVKRYDACEQLRVANSISANALQALQAATHDSDHDVVEAAKNALRTHGANSTATESSAPPRGTNEGAAIPVAATAGSVTTTSGSMWFRPFLIYGALAGLPIPLLGWLWLALAIGAAWKLGVGKGLLGMAIGLGAALIVRIVLGLMILGFGGS